MAIRDVSGLPDDQVPAWVRRSRERKREAAARERERKAPTNGWLGPDGVLHGCAEYGHIYVAKAIYDEQPGVQQVYLDLECDAVIGDLGLPVIPSLLTAALERSGYLKLATRGKSPSDWSAWHLLTAVTPEQKDRLLGWCRDSGQPWPTWIDRDTGRIL